MTAKIGDHAVSARANRMPTAMTAPKNHSQPIANTVSGYPRPKPGKPGDPTGSRA